jgi:hypothetical protein
MGTAPTEHIHQGDDVGTHNYCCYCYYNDYYRYLAQPPLCGGKYSLLRLIISSNVVIVGMDGSCDSPPCEFRWNLH